MPGKLNYCRGGTNVATETSDRWEGLEETKVRGYSILHKQAMKGNT